MISIIAAIAEDNAIGRQGDLLCHLPDDLRHFKELTSGHIVVMGRRTYESLPIRPLPNRRNIVLTSSQVAVCEGMVESIHTIKEVMQIADGQELFIIGGGQIYRQFMPFADKLYITHIAHTWPDADTYFPPIISSRWQCISMHPHPADDKHPYPFSFAEYIHRKMLV